MRGANLYNISVGGMAIIHQQQKKQLPSELSIMFK